MIKEKNVHVRLSESENSRLVKAANKRGVSKSEYLRLAMLDFVRRDPFQEAKLYGKNHTANAN